MGLFSKTDRPSIEVLSERIEDLNARKAELPAEIEAAERALSRSLALADGSDKKHRKALAELRAEAEGIDDAIGHLEAEIREAHAQAAEQKGEEQIKQFTKAVEKLAAERAKVATAVAKHNEVLSELKEDLELSKDTRGLALGVPDETLESFRDSSITHKRRHLRANAQNVRKPRPATPFVGGHGPRSELTQRLDVG